MTTKWRTLLLLSLAELLGMAVWFSASAVVPALTAAWSLNDSRPALYPVGMKIMATWTKEDRGLGIGLLVGALTLGSASPTC